MTRGRWTPRGVILSFVAGCVTWWVYDTRIVESVWRHLDLGGRRSAPSHTTREVIHINGRRAK